jgi:hypothetical protein
VGPRDGLDDLERRRFLTLPGLELRPLGRPARSQSLYGLRYAGSLTNTEYKLEILNIEVQYKKISLRKLKKNSRPSLAYF